MKDTFPTHFCQSCNGACCKIFLLNYTRSDIIRKLLFKTGKLKTNTAANTFECFKQFIFLEDITPQFTKPLQHYERAYTCHALKHGKCSIYNHRMAFCDPYWCYGHKQFACEMRVNGQPPLPFLNNFAVEQATEFGEEFAKELA